MTVHRLAIAALATGMTAAVVSISLPAGEPLTLASPVTYDRAFPAIAYSAKAEGNDIAAFLDKLSKGEIQLEYKAPRGYLDSLLAALGISPTSQVLVFSKTSLQAPYISSKTPRAIYFKDDTYVAWVQGSEYMEAMAIDSRRGPVFFTVHNVPGKTLAFERESLRCMACHDSARLREGGFPRVLLLSSPVEGSVNPALRMEPAEVTQSMAIEDRWGGWFVTGSLGSQLHVGNMPLAFGAPDPLVRSIHNRSNLDRLSGYMDATPYLTDKSDVVALLTLEHQVTVHNLMARAGYEASRLHEVQARPHWQDLPPQQQAALRPFLDPLVKAMTFQDERKLLGRIKGGSGFDTHFAAIGPRDGKGRSLREFELLHRTFRYPLSYLVYSRQFDGLPASVRDYLYRQFAAQFSAPSTDAGLDADRKAALEILADTKPEFAAILKP
jgi:hypothetical protein